mgnify:FL=1|jgi:hypothetical protein
MSEEDYLRESGVGAIRARDSLQSLIDRSKADSDFRSKPADLSSVLQDMPAGRAEFVLRNTRPDGSLNEAAKAMLAPYADNRSEFQRELNRGIQSDPAFAQAYAERFPITNAMMNLPSTILENTGVGRVLSSIGQGARSAADFAGGLFPGLGGTFRGIGEDLADAPGGFIKDFKTMTGLKDDNPVKGEVREVLDVKKNTPEDIVESSEVFKTEEKTLVPFTDSEFYGGRSPTDDFFASQTLPANPDLKFGRQFYAMNQTPAFANYIKEVEKRLGIPTNETNQSSASDFLINQSKTLNAPRLNNEIQVAELNPSQKVVLDKMENRFVFDEGTATPKDMLDKIKPLDKKPSFFGLFPGNEATVQDVLDFYTNNPTTRIQ